MATILLPHYISNFLPLGLRLQFLFHTYFKFSPTWPSATISLPHYISNFLPLGPRQQFFFHTLFQILCHLAVSNSSSTLYFKCSATWPSVILLPHYISNVLPLGPRQQFFFYSIFQIFCYFSVIGHSQQAVSDHHRTISKMPFKWHFAGKPIVAIN